MDSQRSRVHPQYVCVIKAVCFKKLSVANQFPAQISHAKIPMHVGSFYAATSLSTCKNIIFLLFCVILAHQLLLLFCGIVP